jgi:hypothetical protein
MLTLVLLVYIAGLCITGCIIWFPYWHTHLIRINEVALRALFVSDVIYRASMERLLHRACLNTLLLPVWPVIILKKLIEQARMRK